MAAMLSTQPDGAMRAWYRTKKFGPVRPSFESSARRVPTQALVTVVLEPAEAEVVHPA
jgi:hypothetical protein